MNREIKFRVWDKVNKNIFYSKGDPFYDNLCVGLDGKIYSVGDSSGDGGWCYEDDHHINLMQYTGLLDKNGVEIYEGDLLKDEYGTYEVVFDECWFEGAYVVLGWTLNNLDECKFNQKYASKYEIVGNIYENSELLN